MTPNAPGSQVAAMLKALIRSVPDFPKPGIQFFDITTLLRDRDGFRLAIEGLADPFADQRIEVVVGIESRGFILGGAVARRLNAGFCPVRKPGKLPSKAIREAFDLEYGSDAIEIHEDAITPGQRVLIVDDVLATGGTARAADRLVKRLGGSVQALAFLIELSFLNGREKVTGEEVFSLLTY
jgi:adenine phosphoribosyltransferase